ncbi:MAG: methionyl-tRNA formyltransferase [bacterium]|nr:methionyl-tRNA formyltransferase [bacterium]
MEKSSIKLIFFGTPDFAVSALEALIKDGYNIMAVITEPDKEVGRKKILTSSPVKIAAENRGIPVLQPVKLKNNEEFLNTLNTKYLIHNTDCGVVAAYGKIIPPEILNLPKHGLLNIHPSLLPKYRGPSPIQTAILNGDKETGVTIMRVGPELDSGDIVVSSKYQVSSEKYSPEIHKELFKMGGELLAKIIPEYIEGKLKPIPQDHTEATFTKKFSLADGEIKPEDIAEQAYNKIRALNPEPGTYWALPDGKKLKILEVYLAVQPLGKKGLVLKENKPILALADGFLALKVVQPEGKKPMAGTDFANGHSHLFK